MLQKTLKRIRRHNKIRSILSGTADKPRLAVFRSNKNISVQLIDDVAGKTLASASDIAMKAEGTKTQMAAKVGSEIGAKMKELKIKEIVFDRGGFAYHGRVKALAEAVRAESIKF